MIDLCSVFHRFCLPPVLIAVVACTSAPWTKQDDHPLEKARRVSPELLNELSVMATGSLLSELEQESWKQGLSSGTRSLGDYITALLNDDRFAASVAPSLVAGDIANFPNAAIFGGGGILKRLPSPDGPILFLFKPCDPKTAVTVRPWWSQSTVRVCPDSYRPEQFLNPNFKDHCSSDKNALLGAASYFEKTGELITPCGCGPNLMRCFESEAMREAASVSLVAEVRGTIAHVVKSNAPLSDVFTTPFSERNSLVDFAYLRWQVESGERKEIPVLREPFTEQRWEPRIQSVEGEHAGILTAPNFIFLEAGRRGVLRMVYEEMWCSRPSSRGVSTEVLLQIPGSDFRAGEGWRELAARPVCTECHARLDYGAQFFRGYPDSRKGTHFQPSLASAEVGPLYGDDLHDLRGNGPLTPAGFATLAVSQPEYSECMVDKISKYVFGEDSTSRERTQWVTQFKRHGKLRELMHAALLEYATRKTQEQPAALAKVQTADRLVDEGCMRCHEDQQPNLMNRRSTDRVLQMIDAVAYGAMPPDDRLDKAFRRRLITGLASELTMSSDARSKVTDYYLNPHRSLRTPPPEALFALSRAQTHSLNRPETGPLTVLKIPADLQQAAPGIVAALGITAVEDCKAKNLSGEALKTCIAAGAIPFMLSSP